MNVAKLEMPQAQAVTMLDQYRRQARRSANAEYAAVQAGLEEMAKGRAVIHLSDSIRHAGLDAQGLPRLAIARAHRKVVRFRSWRHSEMGVFDSSPLGRLDSRRSPLDARQVVLGPGRRADSHGATMVPMVPPGALQHARVGMSALSRLFVLWEVEEWKPVPPVDPFLLRHLGGEIYVVLAEWDLTPLERAVIAETRR